MLVYLKYILLLLTLQRCYAQTQSFRRIHIFIESFEHITLRYPSHNCCWEERDIEVCTPCGIYYKIYSTFGTFRLDKIGNRVFFFNIKTDYVFTNPQDVVPCANFTIYTSESYTDEIIDTWNVRCLNLQPGEFYNVTSELGVFKNMKATFSIWFECSGYAGYNCQKVCSETSRSYCDLNGDIRCRDGFYGPPECTVDSPCRRATPCKNSGICEAISRNDYNCQCTQLYTGKNCDILRCDPEVCAGTCENGQCVCTSDQIDSSCTSYICDGNFLCQNNGTCGKYNDEIFCVCPPLTSGSYCQFYCNPACVHGRCTKNNAGLDVCYCNDNYTGESCDEEIVDFLRPFPNNKFNTGEIIGIVIAVLVGVALLSSVGYFVWFRYHHMFESIFKMKGLSEPYDDATVSNFDGTL